MKHHPASIEAIKVEARTIATKYEAWERMNPDDRPLGLQCFCVMKIPCPSTNWAPYYNDLMVEAVKYGVQIMPPSGVVVSDHAILSCTVERI